MYFINSYVMCPPSFYGVSYCINPWMRTNLNQVCRERAHQQWQALRALIEAQAEVLQLAPQEGLPDMPFTANGGLILEGKVILSRFLHAQRRGEEEYFERWFLLHHYDVCRLPPDIVFEGAGDCLFDRKEAVLWAGYGFRSAFASHAFLARMLDVEVVSLRLIDSRFYHLDTCFCPLEGGHLLYYPLAFDDASLNAIARRVPEERRIALSERDALNFACNAINIGDRVILNRAGPELVRRLSDAGLETVQTDLSEFIRAGGAAKCLTLRLNEARLQHRGPVVSASLSNGARLRTDL